MSEPLADKVARLEQLVLEVEQYEEYRRLQAEQRAELYDPPAAVDVDLAGAINGPGLTKRQYRRLEKLVGQILADVRPCGCGVRVVVPDNGIGIGIRDVHVCPGEAGR